MRGVVITKTVCVCKDKLSNETVDDICLKNLISVVIKWKEQCEQSEQCEKKKKKKTNPSIKRI